MVNAVAEVKATKSIKVEERDNQTLNKEKLHLVRDNNNPTKLSVEAGIPMEGVEGSYVKQIDSWNL